MVSRWSIDLLILRGVYIEERDRAILGLFLLSCLIFFAMMAGQVASISPLFSFQSSHSLISIDDFFLLEPEILFILSFWYYLTLKFLAMYHAYSYLPTRAGGYITGIAITKGVNAAQRRRGGGEFGPLLCVASPSYIMEFMLAGVTSHSYTWSSNLCWRYGFTLNTN